jgi:hypothetical protein
MLDTSDIAPCAGGCGRLIMGGERCTVCRYGVLHEYKPKVMDSWDQMQALRLKQRDGFQHGLESVETISYEVDPDDEDQDN